MWKGVCPYRGGVSAGHIPGADEPASRPGATEGRRVLPAEAAEIQSYENGLLAMARAVQVVGMYGAPHPAAREAVDVWIEHLAPLLRAHGTFTLGSKGDVALVNRIPLSITNPVVLSLLRKLYTTRAGQLELLVGFDAEAAGAMAAFLAGSDASRLAGEEESLEAWLARSQLRHVRVSRLKVLEVQEGDRVVSGTRKQPPKLARPPGAPDPDRFRPEDVAAWARAFRQDANRPGQPPVLPPGVRDAICAYLRGTTAARPADLVEPMTRAAGHIAQLSELVLKTALVQQEVAQRPDDPVGVDVVNCIRAIVDVLQQAPGAQTDEGWANLARTLAVLEEGVLEKLQSITGGTDDDEEVIRAGVRALQHELEGATLKRDYERKREELLAVEQKIQRFFGSESESAAPGAPEHQDGH